MGQPVHTVEVPDGALALANPDRIILARLRVATLAGGSAGAAVTTNVTGLNLPADFSVFATPDQDAVINITTKSNGGFHVVMSPRLAANTLAAGNVDLLIVA